MSLFLDKERSAFRKLSDDLWSRPEMPGDEVFALQRLCEMLREKSFFVMPSFVLPTAFSAEHAITEEGGPTVCLMCEYDAVPNVGHACGHNLVATAGIAAALAIQSAAKRVPQLSGKLKVLGTPSETSGEGKPRMLEKMAFTDVDVVLAVHPTSSGGLLKYKSPCAATTRVTYHGRESSSFLCPWEGNNAMDAAVGAYYNVAHLRKNLAPDWKISGVLLPDEGICPLEVPDVCRLELFCQTSSAEDQLELQKRLRDVLLAPCRDKGCMVSFDYKLPYIDMICNDVLADVFLEQAQRVRCAGRLFGEGFATASTSESSSASALPESRLATGLGNVSHAVPSLCPLYSLGVSSTDSYLSDDFTRAVCTDDAFDRTMDAAKCIALTALELFRSPDLVKKIRRCFKDQKSTRSCLGSLAASEASDTD
ncbi:unnamed protein product, partial [Ixodes hexagonus]